MKNIPKNRLFFIIVILFLLLPGIYFLIRFTRGEVSLPGTTPQTQTNENTNTVTNDEGTSFAIDTKRLQLASVPYLMSDLKTDSGIKDYVFISNKLVYATDKGVFESIPRKVLSSRPISHINFNQSGTAIYQSNNEWFVFDVESNRTTKVSLEGDSAVINKDATLIATKTNSEVKIMDIPSNKVIKTDTGVSIKKIAWAQNSNKLAVFGTTTSTNDVKIYNEKAETQTTISLHNDSTFLDITPSGNHIAYAKKSSVVLYPTDKKSQKIEFLFDEGDSFSGNWINDKEFIMVRTTPPDNLGRTLDYIWKGSVNGSIQYLTDSFAIIERIDTQIPIHTTQSQNVLFLPEKRGSLWILSLVATQYPFMTEDGVFLRSLPKQVLQPGD